MALLKTIFMKYVIVILLLILNSCTSSSDKSELKGLSASKVDELIEHAASQYKVLLQNAPDSSQYPFYLNEDGSIFFVEKKNWTSGYVPGVMWYLYANTQDQFWKNQAMRWCTSIESEKLATNKHDTGVMLYTSFGLGHKIGGVKEYKDILIEGADSLLVRYNEKIGLIKSWNSKGLQNDWLFPVIIDGMIVLDLPFYAGKFSDNKEMIRKATSHATITMQNHFRDDGSAPHVVDYDPNTGKKRYFDTHQGYSKASSWARGQAWAIYGFPLAYRYTGDRSYLETAMRTADYVFTHENMPDDLIPFWDYLAPEIPDEPRDASAAAIMCAGLLEMCQYLNDEDKEKYLNYAQKIIISLSKPEYLCENGDCQGFILKHSVYNKPSGKGVDTPINFTDFYFLEALIRYKELQNLDPSKL